MLETTAPTLHPLVSAISYSFTSDKDMANGLGAGRVHPERDFSFAGGVRGGARAGLVRCANVGTSFGCRPCFLSGNCRVSETARGILAERPALGLRPIPPLGKPGVGLHRRPVGYGSGRVPSLQK